MNVGRRGWEHPIHRRRVLRGAAALSVGVAGAALIGCSADDGDDGNPESGPSTASETVTGAPQRGGRLSRSIIEDPPDLDMHAGSSYQTNEPIGPIYNNVVKYSADDESDSPSSVVPDLAESWEVSDDGMRWTFTTVANAMFHNGQSFSSEDVKATLERIAHPPEGLVSPRELQFAAVESVETPDATTVVVELSQPSPSFLANLAQGWNSVYSAEDIANDVEFRTAPPNGTGPFRFVNYHRGNRVELTRNDDYHVEGLPHLDEVVVHIMADAQTELTSFQAGELDMLRSVTKAAVEALEDAMPGQAVIDGPKPGYSFGSINFGNDGPWSDIRARHAVSMAIDQEEAVQVLRDGWGSVGGYHTPGASWALPQERLFNTAGYEPWSEASIAEARKLLQAAGIEDGHSVTIMTRSGSSNYERLALFTQDKLAAIGLNPDLFVVDSSSAYEMLNNGSFDISAWSHGFALDDPDALFAEFYLQNSPRNYSRAGSDEVDDLYARQSVEMDPDARLEIVHDLEQAALEVYGKVITEWGQVTGAYWNHLHGWTRKFGHYNNTDLSQVWKSV